MKKRKTLILLFTTAILTLTPTSAFAAEAAVSQPTQVVTTAPAAPTPVPKKQGWETLKSGKKRYYKDGQRLTGFQKIGKSYFYFNSNGTMLKKKPSNGEPGILPTSLIKRDT